MPFIHLALTFFSSPATCSYSLGTNINDPTNTMPLVFYLLTCNLLFWLWNKPKLSYIHTSHSLFHLLNCNLLIKPWNQHQLYYPHPCLLFIHLLTCNLLF